MHLLAHHEEMRTEEIYDPVHNKLNLEKTEMMIGKLHAAFIIGQ